MNEVIIDGFINNHNHFIYLWIEGGLLASILEES